MRIRSIQQAVADRYGISFSDLMSPTRCKPHIARARQIAMYLARRETDCSLPRIAQAFRRHHTTVMHACRLVEAMRSEDTKVAKDLIVLSYRLRAREQS